MTKRAMRFTIVAIAVMAGAVTMRAQGQPRLDAPRPIDAGVSLWAEELTWMEIRDLVKGGTTTIIIGAGGVEQNGPYVAGGKHNFVLQTVLPYIARAIPNSLIAPIVKFVPEGRIEPTTGGHMNYPGTISVEAATFQALLTDICRSYKAHGFIDIILIGDSGGNQAGLRNVANTLNARWAAESATVHFLPEYYDQDRWSYDYLKTLGITQINKTPGQAPDARTDMRNGMHDDIYYESQIAALDPTLIRADERRKAGLLSLHGVDLSPIEKTIDLGKKLAEYRAGITARAFRASQQRLRPASVERLAKDQHVSGTVSSRRMADGKEWTTVNLNVNTPPSYCYDDAALNCGRYGRMYTWESAQRACPSLGDGWRLPTDDEWRRMAMWYGGVSSDSADRGTAAFTALLSGGRSGFNAVLGGNRSAGQYGRLEAHGVYWTASENDPATAPFYNFGKGGGALHRQAGGEKQMAISVRCIRE